MAASGSRESEDGSVVPLSVMLRQLQQFEQGSLTRRIAELETRLRGIDRAACAVVLGPEQIGRPLWDAAMELKRATGQIHVLIHTIGVLLALPHVMEDGEFIERLSLGAGNTGRTFDLETNRRVAEFSFIDWKGGPESMRKKQLFADFYKLAETNVDKERDLFVKGLAYPLRFLESGTSLESAMSRDTRLHRSFHDKHAHRFRTVGEYYTSRRHLVRLRDLAELAPFRSK